MPAIQVEVNQTVAVVQTTVATVAGSGGGGGAPSGPAGGALSGSYPNPAFAVDMATQAELDAAASTLQTNIDNLATGMRFRDTVRVATTANVNVASPGTAVFDGVTMVSGDAVLLVGQTTPSQNGAYTFNGSGSAMTRRADSNTSAEVLAATVYPVAEGTFADQLAVLTTNNPITLGTTPLSFQFIAPGAGISSSLIDAKGDLLVGLADNNVGRFPAGADGTVPIYDASQPFGMRAGSPSVSGAGNDPTVLALDMPPSGAAVGATTITVRGTMPAGFNSKDCGIGLDPFTTNGESLGIQSIVGQVITLSRPLRLPHADGGLVFVNPPNNPAFYGAKGDINVTDDWRAFQRQMIERQTFGPGPGNYHLVRQPIYAPNSGGGALLWIDSSFNSNCVQSNLPAGSTGQSRPYSAVVQCARGFGSFTAVSGNAYLTAGTELEFLGSNAVGKTIALNNPYGETLPGGIVSGRVYVIASYDSATRRIGIAEAATPTTPIVFSSSGAGWVYSNMDSTMKITWSGLRLNISKAGTLDGVHVVYEQQSDIPNLRVDYALTDTADASGVVLGGQYGHVTNLESQANAGALGDKSGVTLVGTGHYIDFFTTNATGKGMTISGQHITIAFWLCETVTPGFSIVAGTRNLVLGNGNWSHPNVNQAAIVLPFGNGSPSSWESGPIMTVNAQQRIIEDNQRGLIFKAWDGNRWSGIGDTDEQGVFPGIVVRAGPAGVGASVELKGRYHMGTHSAANGPFKLRRLYIGVNVNTAGASDEVWLSAGAFDNLDHVVGKVSSAANTLTIKNDAGTVLDTIGPGTKKVIHYRSHSGVWVKESEVTL